ncbi:Rha family transcriptional regulator [Aliarcobacter butzleri]|uniref:Rha family transcriptional regulator n=1 Tax=Aliarcobacter butzleri TaxID=28197 RepID=UPI0028744481|nr:Rha family transcriptional regulator [Aliarcobacter butzleri]MDS1370674.1 Rha family transcriptional regulator [Aliarcobacter butzleri]
MKNQITIVNEDMTVSHRVIAEQTDNKEVSVANLINKYISDFEVFGKVHFKNEAIKNTKNRINEIVTYYLNEQQSYLLLTYLRNSEIVRNFKIALVKAFFEIKKQLENKSSNTDIQIELSELRQEIKDLKKQLILKEDENPFKGFYTPNWAFRKRENEYAYSRKDWMLLLNECERTLVAERQNRKYKQLLISGASK